MYKLKKNENGDVWYIKKAGSSFVKATMPIGKAEGIIGTGKVEKSGKFDGFEICINDGKYYIAGTFKVEEEKSEPKEEKTYGNPKHDSFKKHNN